MGARLNGLTSILKLRPEIKSLIERGEFKSIREFDPSPSLADVVLYYELSELSRSDIPLPKELKDEYSIPKGKSIDIFTNPEELFTRTFLSENMDDIIVKVFAGLLSGEAVRKDGVVTTLRSRIIILPSLMGGGKTHLLITLYHIIRLYNNLVVKQKDPVKFRNIIRKLDGSLAERLYNIVKSVEPKRIRIAALDGYVDKLTPDPHQRKPTKKAVLIRSGGSYELKVYEVHTLWGSIAHYLGDYTLLSKRDESNTIPSREELTKLLSGDPFLIMIDEPLVYAERYGDLERLKKFFQVLAVSIKETNNGIFILSVPVSREELTSGAAKSTFVKELYSVLSRAQPGLEIEPPLKTPELVNVLKKRLFENEDKELRKVGREVAKRIITRGGEIVESAINAIFRSKSEFEKRVEECYPFNPLFLELLEDYFNYLKYLQRTRDALRLSIMTLATIYNRLYRDFSAEFYLISPYHIPLHDDSVRSHLVNPGETDFQILMSMYDNDVVKASQTTTMKRLSMFIGSFIWLRSIIGRGVPEKRFLKLYPSINEIILAVYDPASFAQNDIGPGIIGDVLEELYSYGNYLIKLENRYFMTQLLPVGELIAKRIRDISDLEARKKLYAVIKEMFPIETKKREKVSRVFNRIEVVSFENEDLVPISLEDDSPLLLVFSFEPKPEILDSYLVRNNVVAVIPSMSKEIKDPELGKRIAEEFLVSTAKELTAIESVTKEDLARMYGKEFANATFSKLKSRANNVKKKLTNMLKNEVFDRIVIGKPKWEIRQAIGSAIPGVEESTKAVEELLIENSFIPPDYSLSKEEIIAIARRLGKTCKDELTNIEQICKEVEIGELWNWFMTTVEPKIRSTVIDFNGFLNGIQQLYEEDLSIGFEYGDKFIWKTIREEAPAEPRDRGYWSEVEKIVRELRVDIKSLKIVPWRGLIHKFVEHTKSLEDIREEGGVKQIVRVKVTYTQPFGEEVEDELETFLQKDWEAMIRTAVFWKEVRSCEYSFLLNLESVKVNERLVDHITGITVEPGQKINITVKMDATDYPFPITLKVYTDRESYLEKVFKDGKVFAHTLEISMKNPGEHQVTIEASGEDPRQFSQKRFLIVKVRGEVGEELQVDYGGLKNILKEVNYSRILLNSMEIEDLSKIVDVVRILRTKGEVRIRKVELNDISLTGLKSKGTTLIVNKGIFESIEELKAFIEPLSRAFKFESGSVKIFFDNLNINEDILSFFDKLEEININPKYNVNLFKKIG